MPKPSRRGKHRFAALDGAGDICAAGLIPWFRRTDGLLHVMLQLEVDAKGHEVLAGFGGKVEEQDASWQATMLREWEEETHATELIGSELTQHISWCSGASQMTEDMILYVRTSKYQTLLVYCSEHIVSQLQLLKATYFEHFSGETEAGRRAVRFVFAALVSQGPEATGYQLIDIDTGHPIHLSLKPELRVGLNTIYERFYYHLSNCVGTTAHLQHQNG